MLHFRCYVLRDKTVVIYHSVSLVTGYITPVLLKEKYYHNALFL